MKQEQSRNQGEMLSDAFSVIRDLLSSGQTTVEVEIHVYDSVDMCSDKPTTQTSIEIKSSRFIRN